MSDSVPGVSNAEMNTADMVWGVYRPVRVTGIKQLSVCVIHDFDKSYGRK